MLKYWQSRNIELFSVGSQMNYKIEELLKMAYVEYFMTVFTLIGYNKKLKAQMEKNKSKHK